jgi:hypothetical protein
MLLRVHGEPRPAGFEKLTGVPDLHEEFLAEDFRWCFVAGAFAPHAAGCRDDKKRRWVNKAVAWPSTGRHAIAP